MVSEHERAVPPPVPADEDTFPQDELDRTSRRRWILQYARPGGVGAEFGVFRGHFAVEIAEVLQPSKFYLVDPWTRSGERFEWGEIPYTNFNRLTTAQAFADARARMAPYADRMEIEFAEQWSSEFCRDLEVSLDFAYIDTDHTYETTLVDLEAVHQIIADDGVIMGDDWQTNPTHMHAGVQRAVNDFIRNREYELLAAGPEGQWCIRHTPIYPTPRRWLPNRIAPSLGDELPGVRGRLSSRLVAARRGLSESWAGPFLRRIRSVLERVKAALGSRV
jgi:hypothetical protein